MPKNTNLVPTTILDKNGKQTTVHKKVDQTSSGATNMPSPSLFSSTGKVTSPSPRDETNKALLDWIIDFASLDTSDPEYRAEIAEFKRDVEKFPDDIADLVLDAFLNGPDDKWFLFTSIFNTRSHETIRETIAFAPYTYDRKPAEGFTMRNPTTEQIRMISGLRHYSDHIPPMTDYSTAPDDVKEKLGALLTVTAMLIAEKSPREHAYDSLVGSIYQSGPIGGHVLALTDQDLIQLLVERPSEAERIGSIIIETKMFDAGRMRSILDSETPAISNGIL